MVILRQWVESLPWGLEYAPEVFECPYSTIEYSEWLMTGDKLVFCQREQVDFYELKLGSFFKAFDMYCKVQPAIFHKVSHGTAVDIDNPGHTYVGSDFWTVIPIIRPKAKP